MTDHTPPVITVRPKGPGRTPIGLSTAVGTGAESPTWRAKARRGRAMRTGTLDAFPPLGQDEEGTLCDSLAHPVIAANGPVDGGWANTRSDSALENGTVFSNEGVTGFEEGPPIVFEGPCSPNRHP